MNVLIWGGNGWIGGMLCKELSEHKIDYVIAKSRMENFEECEEEFKSNDVIRPITHILCCAGKTHGPGCSTIDYLEDKIRENVESNLLGPMNLGFIARDKHIHYTYLGTGCIFNYDEKDMNGILSSSDFEVKSYKEEDEPNFYGSGYSIVKGVTDKLMKRISCLNLRIRMPITYEKSDRNFIDKILSYEKICSIPNSMTVMDDFIPIIVSMMIAKDNGTYNLVNPGLISHNEILQMYHDIIDNEYKWKNMSLIEQRKILKSDRSNNKLSSDKICSKYKINNIHDSVMKIMVKRSKDN